MSFAALAGALLLSAAAVAPLAFRVFSDDHQRAGLLAGEVFKVTYWCAAALGVLGMVMGVPRRPRPTLLALLLVVLGFVQLAWLAPLIAAHGEGWPFSFAALHGIASIVHLALLGTALALAWIHSAAPAVSGSST